MKNCYLSTLESAWHDLKHVFINEEKLQELIEKVRKDNLIVPAWAEQDIQPSMDCQLSEWLNFVCWTNTINFAFTNFEPPYYKFTIEYPGGVFPKGAFAMEASFMRAKAEDIPVFDTRYMRKVSKKDVEYIFRPISKEHQIPMIWERWVIFHEVGEVLLESYNGRWLNLFVDAGWRAFNEIQGNRNGIVDQLVSNFPSFQDRRFYKSHLLEFHKRAQLLVMMYHGRAINSGGRFPLIKDIGDIGPIADYEVPKALKVLGVIEYAPEFEAAIQNHKTILPNDEREIENRLAMSYAMKRVCDGAGVSMIKLDPYVWYLGKKSGLSHILVPTIDY